MRRRDFIKSAGLTVLTLSVSGCCEGLLGTKSANKKPNIIYILADDLGYGDLGCYGQKIIKTPNIDAMAKEGMRFTQHYAGSTVCAPSRSVLMTGMHTGHTYIRGNKNAGTKYPGNCPLPSETYTVAKMLKSKGYTTGCFGKWGLGYPGSEGDPLNQGFDRFFGHNSQRNAHSYYPNYLWDDDKKIEYPNNISGEKGTYSHDLICEKAFDFIKSNYDKPFFVYFAVTIPHAELQVPDDSMKPYLELQEDGPWGDPSKPYRFPIYNAQARPHAAFAGMVSRLDGSVGQLFELLAKLGIDDNTLVMFTSDNGAHAEGGADPKFFNSTGWLRGIKRDLYEGGIRVPMIARWPGKVKASSVSGHVSAFWDVLPTCAEIAKAEVPENIDGISILPTLTGEGKQEKHKFLYWEFHEQGVKQAVRIGKYKGVRLNVAKKPNGPIELYDLSNDIGETKNIADTHPRIVKRIKRIMKNQRTPNKEFPVPALDG